MQFVKHGHWKQWRALDGCGAVLAYRLAAVLALSCVLCANGAGAPADTEPRIVDLSLLVAPNLPCTWPLGWPHFQLNHYLRIGPLSPYNSDILVVDGNTGTQIDVPPHSVPHPDTNLPNAGPYGRLFTDKVPAWQFVGEACVIDCRDLIDAGSNGASALITKDRIRAWEQRYRPLRPGDVVLFRSGYSDKYYLPLPAGRRFLADPLDRKTPAWPDPDPECMEYLASRKLMALGTDSPSMGPVPDLAEPTHLAGLRHGMIWAESLTGLNQLPATGAFYCMLGPKHAGAAYSEARALAVVDDPLAGRLIESARKKQVVDLSVVLSIDLPVSWAGRGAGNHRQPYYKVPLFFAQNLGVFHVTHMLDSHAGTHLVTPSYALPPKGFDNQTYVPAVQAWLVEYEQKYGKRGTSDETAEQVPLSQTCGWCRVIDVTRRIGTTNRNHWPQSPEIRVEDIRQYEAEHGALKPNEIVIFFSGYSDRYFKTFPQGLGCIAEPLEGKREGWPAPGPDAIRELAKKGIRCIGTDGPSLGGVDPKRAFRPTGHWAATEWWASSS